MPRISSVASLASVARRRGAEDLVRVPEHRVRALDDRRRGSRSVERASGPRPAAVRRSRGVASRRRRGGLRVACVRAARDRPGRSAAPRRIAVTSSIVRSKTSSGRSRLPTRARRRPAASPTWRRTATGSPTVAASLPSRTGNVRRAVSSRGARLVGVAEVGEEPLLGRRACAACAADRSLVRARAPAPAAGEAATRVVRPPSGTRPRSGSPGDPRCRGSRRSRRAAALARSLARRRARSACASVAPRLLLVDQGRGALAARRPARCSSSDRPVNSAANSMSVHPCSASSCVPEHGRSARPPRHAGRSARTSASSAYAKASSISLGELGPGEVLDDRGGRTCGPASSRACLLAAEPLVDDLRRAVLAAPPLARGDPAAQLGHDLAEHRHAAPRAEASAPCRRAARSSVYTRPSNSRMPSRRSGGRPRRSRA